MRFQFFGIRGQAFFDAWTIIHLAFWIAVGGNLEHMQIAHWIRWPVVLASAYLWEITESWLDESGLMAGMTTESWVNRWVSDPLMALVGTFLGMLTIGA